MLRALPLWKILRGGGHERHRRLVAARVGARSPRGKPKGAKLPHCSRRRGSQQIDDEANSGRLEYAYRENLSKAVVLFWAHIIAGSAEVSEAKSKANFPEKEA